MLDLSFRLRTPLVLICLVVCGAQISAAAADNPMTMWADSSTGLLWMGRTSPNTMSWLDAKNYCATLQLDGYSDWKLPTLAEAEGKIVASLRTDGNIWTTIISDTQQVNIHGIFYDLRKRTSRYALCNRVMEADLLQLAKDAQIIGPMPDLVTLKAMAPLYKAWRAYHVGQYQESVNQAKNALLIKPDYAFAYWALGISYGRLEQWDLAISNLETSLKIEKNYEQAMWSLNWAQEGQKAAKKGKSPKLQGPQWDVWY
jgi:tetratricopeptide (TPR) repeat protein